MSAASEFLYLSRADVANVNLGLRDVTEAVEEAFRALGQGRVTNVPKSGLEIAADRFFHAMPAALPGRSVAGIKWVGVATGNAAHGLPPIDALIAVSDIETGTLLAVMDGDWITAVRPAAVSLVASRRLARRASERIGFVACGRQAYAHLAALQAEFPLKDLRCYSRRTATAEIFAAAARSRGLATRVVATAREAIVECDIVVTSVPRSSGLVCDLDPRILVPGAFVSGPDLARTWMGEQIAAFDLVATDDVRQTEGQAAQGLIPWRGRLDVGLADLVLGRHPGRRTDEERIMFVHPGMAIGDLAVATLVLACARAAGLGRMLRR